MGMSRITLKVVINCEISFTDPERAPTEKECSDNATCCPTFEGSDHDDVLSKFQARLHGINLMMHRTKG